MRKLRTKDFYAIQGVMDSSDDIKKDVATEVLCELFNSKYTTDEERVTGIIEAISFVTKIKPYQGESK